MRKKETELRAGTQLEPDNALLENVKAIFASNKDDFHDPETELIANQLDEVINFIGDCFIDALGTSHDYSIDYGEPESIGGIIVVGKTDYDATALPKLIGDTRKALLESNLTVDEGIRLVGSVIDRIKKECTVEYPLVDDVIHQTNGGNHLVLRSENDAVSPLCVKYPIEVQFALGNLEGCGMDHVYQETQKHIESRDPAAEVVEIKRLMEDCWMDKPSYYATALQQLLEKSLKNIEWLKEEREYRAAIGPSDNDDLSPEQAAKLNNTKANYDDELDKKRRFEGRLEYKQIMVLLSEFIPEFGDADNTKKGKFIAAISPYQAEKRISDDFSYINRFAPEHSEIVKYWRNELKRTRRGRPRSNKYQKIGR